MTANREISDVHLLAEQLAAAQNLESARAEQLAEEISTADDDIWAAALEWTATGQMPAEPVIEQRTPAALSVRMKPSMVFTTLMGLRSDPGLATTMLNHAPRKFRPAGEPQAEEEAN